MEHPVRGNRFFCSDFYRIVNATKKAKKVNIQAVRCEWHNKGMIMVENDANFSKKEEPLDYLKVFTAERIR